MLKLPFHLFDGPEFPAESIQIINLTQFLGERRRRYQILNVATTLLFSPQPFHVLADVLDYLESAAAHIFVDFQK